MSDIRNKLLEILDHILLMDEFSDCYLVELNLNNKNRIEVFLDCDSGLSINKCVSISRLMSKELDSIDLITEKYNLEVSSPGIDRPLIKRQYAKNIGKILSVTDKNNIAYEGKLMKTDENAIEIEIEDKKNKKILTINFNEIELAKIILNLNKKKK
jgi:ribosome maturation factor RimP